MKNEDLIVNFANKLSKLISVQDLSFNIPDGFQVIEQQDSSNSIFVAIKNNTIIQFLIDGLLNTESFSEHLEKVITSINVTINENNLYTKDSNYLKFLKTYHNQLFNFEIYVQDIMANSNNFIRQLNAYFVEPKSQQFCQISVASGQYKVQERSLINNITNLENDDITKELLKLLINFIDEIKYNV